MDYIEKYKAGEPVTWGRRVPNWVIGKNGYLAQRDGYFCIKCNAVDDLVLHYLDGTRENTAPDNIKLICKECNNQPLWWNGQNV